MPEYVCELCGEDGWTCQHSLNPTPVNGEQVRRSPVFAALSPETRETVAREADYRRLQLLGVAPEVIAPLLDYVEELNNLKAIVAESFPHMLGEDGKLTRYFAVDPNATSAGKYVQVVDMEPHWQTGEIRPTSVHSVVNKVTGEVSKPAGWKKGPAKSASKARKGQPLVAFTLTDPEQCAEVFARMDTYGSYLYSK